jgi:hypothetical protein
VEGIELPPALALLLGTDLLGARERPFQYGLEIGLPDDLAADIADEAAESRSQQAQLAMMTLELLGMGIAARHHGDAQIGLAQLQPALWANRLSPLIAACSSLASVGNVTALGWTVVSTVTRLMSRRYRRRSPDLGGEAAK